MAFKKASSDKDLHRLQSKINKLRQSAWEELNEVSGSDPKYANRLKVFEAYNKLFSDLGGDTKDHAIPEAASQWGTGSSAITPEMKKFAQEYSLWVITYGQTYINALSPKFQLNADPMEIFTSKYYGTGWFNGLTK